MIERIASYETISIVGNVKNAGKTTVLNRLIQSEHDRLLGLTSIGMDGEALDNVTFLPKPRIMVYPGFLVATASKCLSEFAAGYEKIMASDINTPLGSINIVRILTAGHCLVAGPSDISSMEKIVDMLKALGAERIYVDGAFSRQGAAKITNAAILCIGANRSPVMDIVIDEAKTLVMQLTLKQTPEKMMFLEHCREVTAIDDAGNSENLGTNSVISDPVRVMSAIKKTTRYLYLPQALTSTFLKAVIKEKKYVNLKLVINSPVDLILDEKNARIMELSKERILVLRPVNLVGICINPFSPSGYVFDKDQFSEKIETAIGFPVIDVMEEKDDDE